MSNKNISLYLWEEFKKLHPPKNPNDSNDFESWIKDGLNDRAINWAKEFAKHLTSKDQGDALNIEREEKDFQKWKKNKNGKIIIRPTLTTSKLRKFFGAVKKIQVAGKFEEDEYRAFKLLMPKLAYDVGREKNKQHKIVDFYFAIKEMSDQVENPATAQNKEEPQKQFKNFVELLESIVAYFKAYENHIALDEQEQN